MAAILRDSFIVVVIRTRPRAVPLAMITMRRSTHWFPFPFHDECGAPLGSWSSATYAYRGKLSCSGFIESLVCFDLQVKISYGELDVQLTDVQVGFCTCAMAINPLTPVPAIFGCDKFGFSSTSDVTTYDQNWHLKIFISVHSRPCLS